ncbi:adhesion G-protein coupled receptor F1 [Pimephales promelas]|uniref:adhesion G-protein coupled receptor F1 n=1 Tax=Pimephales promelas TaxID=90988 RepID=UPI001955CF4C|nr:adhesion G-protein coupled receptor F1 [Pimephales promelas]
MKDVNNFKVDPTSIAETDNKNLRTRDPVFPEQDITLSCPDNPLGNVDWKFQGEIIQQSSRYVFLLERRSLVVKNVTIKDNGAMPSIENCFSDAYDCLRIKCVIILTFRNETQPKNFNEMGKVVGPATLTDFVIKLTNATRANFVDVVQSQATVSTIVEMLNEIAVISQNTLLDEVVLTNFLNIVDVISSESAKPVWVGLNSNAASQGDSSQLLNSIENVIKAISDTNFNITSPSNSFLFKKVTTSVDYRDVLRLNSTAEIFIPDITSTHKNITITAVAFSSLGNVLPARNRTDNLNETENVINGLIVIVNTSKPINKIELSFEKRSNTVARNNNSVILGNPQCAFWEFNLFNRTGGWDSTGCEVIRINGNVTCRCNHTTSFSILMSPYAPDDLSLAVITYVGVAISIASLVVCLFIEMIIWKEISRNSTSYLRHVCLVNIALSLLIADICFIIAAAIAKPGEDYNINSCSAVVFFTHFFYLALFFWMMVSALLLLYRTIMVFSQISTSLMMAIAFIVGYGAPLLISVITVASTSGSQAYVTQNGTCWLNWDISRNLLAFVIPALVIVAVNIVVIIIVVVKMLRGRVGESNRGEKNVLVVILRSVAILTPLFGITWGLGLGIVIEPKALALHYLFTIFNSLQGFLILVLGLLMEKKVRETLKARFTRLTGSRASYSLEANTHSSSSNRTTLTDVFNTILRRGRNARANINSSNSHESFLNA